MLLKPLRSGQVFLFTEGLTEEELSLTAVKPTTSIDQAIVAAVANANDKRIAVIPEGPYVVPRYRPGI